MRCYVKSIMNERPVQNEPGYEQASSRDVQNYNECIRHETIRIAVLEMASDTEIHRSMPVPLRDVVVSLFPGFLDSYLMTCRSNAHRDGQVCHIILYRAMWHNIMQCIIYVCTCCYVYYIIL